jgi:hypothetical protein
VQSHWSWVCFEEGEATRKSSALESSTISAARPAGNSGQPRPCATAPSLTALAKTRSIFSTSRYRFVGQEPAFFAPFTGWRLGTCCGAGVPPARGAQIFPTRLKTFPYSPVSYLKVMTKVAAALLCTKVRKYSACG